MEAVILDACGTLNLSASGRFIPILTALECEWYLPSAVEAETVTGRQADPDDPAKLIVVPFDFQPAFEAGALMRCNCEGEAELALFMTLATRIGDGEAMGLAIAKCRGWSVMTDDRKARRIANQEGVKVVSTPEILHAWASGSQIGSVELGETLRAIERFANYRPAKNTPHYVWWTALSGTETV